MRMPAKRNASRRSWPRGLYEPRPGYYVFRTTDGRTLAIGRVPLVHALAEAAAANLALLGVRPSLAERVTGAAHTIADVLGQMPAATAANTIKGLRSVDKAINEALGPTKCHDLTTAACAQLVEGVEARGKHRWAQAVRSRLIAVCNRGRQLGWMDDNPAEPTRAPRPVVQRGRLTLETFAQIRAVAGQVAEWLPRAMDLALCTGADRMTCAGMTVDDVAGEWLEFRRSKTGIRLRIPLELELVAAGLRLRDLVTPLVPGSGRLICHVQVFGNAPRGSAVHPDRISHAFTEARKLAQIPDAGAPTFHELRSLAKRLYEAQGNVDTRWLLGHADEKTARKYADPRGAEAVTVRVDPLPQVHAM